MIHSANTFTHCIYRIWEWEEYVHLSEEVRKSLYRVGSTAPRYLQHHDHNSEGLAYVANDMVSEYINIEMSALRVPQLPRMQMGADTVSSAGTDLQAL